MSKENLILDVFKKGDFFGGEAIVSDGNSKFTFEAKSKKVQVLKIHKQQFLEHLGGVLGEPICVLQGNE